MAMTYTQVEGAEAVAALPEGTLVAEVVDHGHDKRFYPVNAVDGTAASMIFPHITSVSRVTDPAGGATGPVNLRLAAGLQDLVRVTSPMHFTLSPDVRLVTAEGVF